MPIHRLVALFGAMMTLAIIPSPSVCLVVARSMASGFAHGAAIAFGILLGDMVFILLALYGLAAIADTLDIVLLGVNALGAVYLIWLGISLWRTNSEPVDLEVSQKNASWLADVLCGFLITLGDPKAILFYMSFFPAFIDLAQISMMEMGIILAIATISVGGVKLAYAYLADQSRQWLRNPRAKRVMNRMAGVVMIATGILVVAKT